MFKTVLKQSLQSERIQNQIQFYNRITILEKEKEKSLKQRNISSLHKKKLKRNGLTYAKTCKNNNVLLLLSYPVSIRPHPH